jgi:hypothetical protein
MENWKCIGATGYQVSDMGRVMTPRGLVMKPIFNNSYRGTGYHKVKIEGKGRYIHRLVADAFIPNPDNKAHVNHKNGNKFDNSLVNLEWATVSENNQHAFDTGLKSAAKGERSGANKISEGDARIIKSQYKKIRTGVLAKRFGVAPSTICYIGEGRTWRHLENAVRESRILSKESAA